MKKRVKKYLAEHPVEALHLYTIGVAGVSVAAYSAICKHYGYWMSHPLDYDEEARHIRATSITGRVLVSKMED